MHLNPFWARRLLKGSTARGCFQIIVLLAIIITASTSDISWKKLHPLLLGRVSTLYAVGQCLMPGRVLLLHTASLLGTQLLLERIQEPKSKWYYTTNPLKLYWLVLPLRYRMGYVCCPIHQKSAEELLFPVKLTKVRTIFTNVNLATHPCYATL